MRGDLAKAKIGDIQKDVETYAAITKAHRHRRSRGCTRWKALNALVLQPATLPLGSRTWRRKSDKTGERVDGRVTTTGSVSVLSRTPSALRTARSASRAVRRIATTVRRLRGRISSASAMWCGTLDDRGGTWSRRRWSRSEARRSRRPRGRSASSSATDARSSVSPGHPTADGRHVADLRAGDELDGARVASAQREPYDGGFTFDVRPAGASRAYWANGILLSSTIP
jgi:hypothetical protein